VQVAGIVWELGYGSVVAVAKCVMLDTCAGISCGNDGGVVSEHARESRMRIKRKEMFFMQTPPLD
jgi:hypothetical protein